MIKKAAGLILVLSMLLTLGSCSQKLGKIKESPEAYVDKTIRVRGQLEKVFPLVLGSGSYSVGVLGDDTGVLPVLLQTKMASGSQIKIKARVAALTADSSDELEAALLGDLADEATVQALADNAKRLLMPLMQSLGINSVLVEQ
ncbi:MAG: hypothetical protein D6B26_05925 [Spirochaetaceae bacterium]|nr:MAG: hypothetical protein D6B26_05925 [Spirochaetaceae bacterium]